MMRIVPFLLVVTLALSACNTVRDKMPGVEVEGVSSDGVSDALQSPLYDFNLKKMSIPDALSAIERVYGVDPKDDCASLRDEVLLLDSVLGPDAFDFEGSEDSEEKDSISLDAEDALGSAVSGLIPYGDVVRYLSGASKHEKKVASAYFRGQLRRAFIKGRIISLKCMPVPRLNPIIEQKSEKSEKTDKAEKAVKAEK